MMQNENPQFDIAFYVSVLALSISIFSAIISWMRLRVAKKQICNASDSSERALIQAEEANRIASISIDYSKSSNEIFVRKNLSDARAAIQKYSIEYKKNKRKYPNSDDRLMKNNFSASVENYLNVFEQGCILYLDEKIDKHRFENDFKGELLSVVQSYVLRGQFLTVESTYENIMEVYKLFTENK